MTKPECRMTKEFRISKSQTTQRRSALRHPSFAIHSPFAIRHSSFAGVGALDFGMNFAVPSSLEAEIDELVTHYPQKRSASLMVLHAVQGHFGWISPEAIEWVARKLELQPINIYEL